MRNLLVIILLLALMGCSLDSTMTKLDNLKAKAVQEFNKYYLTVINKIIDTVGSENINLILSQFSTDVAAEMVINKYEEISKEQFSPKNREVIKAGLMFIFGKIKEDLTSPEGTTI